MPVSNVRSEFRSGDLVFEDETNSNFPLPVCTSANMAKQTKSGNYTLTAADSGYFTYVSADATITLPVTVSGYTYTIICAGLDADVEIIVELDGSDQIIGAGTTGGAGNPLTNTKTTARFGDYVKLVGDGTTGWFIQELRGTWALTA